MVARFAEPWFCAGADFGAGQLNADFGSGELTSSELTYLFFGFSMPTEISYHTDSPLPYRKSVGLCLFNQEGLVFVAERRDTPGAWQMPQGGIDEGEDPVAAARRELREEIDVSSFTILAELSEWLRYEFPDFKGINSVFKGKYCGQEQKWFALRFTGPDHEINLAPGIDHEPPEFSDWKWVTLDQAVEGIVTFKRPVYTKMAAEFQRFAKPS
jgi:putative (di)nucleoside polyphosphate hydrolase